MKIYHNLQNVQKTAAVMKLSCGRPAPWFLFAGVVQRFLLWPQGGYYVILIHQILEHNVSLHGWNVATLAMMASSLSSSCTTLRSIHDYGSPFQIIISNYLHHVTYWHDYGSPSYAMTRILDQSCVQALIVTIGRVAKSSTY